MQHIDDIAVWELKLDCGRCAWRRRLCRWWIGYLNSRWRTLRVLGYRENSRHRVRLIACLRIGVWLAAFGCLVLWLGPMGVVTFLHHYMHVVLDGFDRKRLARGLLPGTMSLWAGVYAWVVLILASSITAFHC